LRRADPLLRLLPPALLTCSQPTSDFSWIETAARRLSRALDPGFVSLTHRLSEMSQEKADHTPERLSGQGSALHLGGIPLNHAKTVIKTRLLLDFCLCSDYTIDRRGMQWCVPCRVQWTTALSPSATLSRGVTSRSGKGATDVNRESRAAKLQHRLTFA
jgi:hypothetical protein